jgi:hypothetical protein
MTRTPAPGRPAAAGGGGGAGPTPRRGAGRGPAPTGTGAGDAPTGRRRRRAAAGLVLALAALYLLHNDFWFWREPRLVLGLPAGLLYHAAYCLAAAALAALAVRHAWPPPGIAGAGAAGADDPESGRPGAAD